MENKVTAYVCDHTSRILGAQPNPFNPETEVYWEQGVAGTVMVDNPLLLDVLFAQKYSVYTKPRIGS